MTLVLTDNASSVIRTLSSTTESAGEAGLRIAGSESDGRTNLAVALAGTPRAEDQVVEQDGARIFLDPAAADVLEDQVLDATLEPDGNVRFQLSSQ